MFTSIDALPSPPGKQAAPASIPPSFVTDARLEVPVLIALIAEKLPAADEEEEEEAVDETEETEIKKDERQRPKQVAATTSSS